MNPSVEFQVLVSRASVAREFAGEEGNDSDGDLIDFRVGQARQALRNASSKLQKMLVRLNARPGRGINFDLIYEIASAERKVHNARAALRAVEASFASSRLR